MPRPDIKVRMAQNDEHEVVSNLVSEVFDMGGWMPEFGTVFPYWLVAEISGEVVGTVNLRISLPVSSIEMLAIDSTLGKIDRSRVAMMLIDSAITCCGAAGSTVFSCMIPETMESYQQVLEDRGMVEGNRGAILFGRIR